MARHDYTENRLARLEDHHANYNSCYFNTPAPCDLTDSLIFSN